MKSFRLGASKTTPSDAPGNPRTDEGRNHIFAKALVVLVGPEEMPFVIHPELICTKFSSRYLERCISRTWYREENPLYLPEVQPQSFQMYLAWSYGGVEMAKGGFDDVQTMHHMVCVFIVADQLNDIAMMNRIMDAIVYVQGRENEIPHPSTVKRVYECLPEKSPMRTFMEDIHIYCFDRDVLDDFDHRTPADFLLEVSIGLRSMSPTEVRFQDETIWGLLLGITKTLNLLNSVNPLEYEDSVEAYEDMLRDNPCCYHYHDTKYTQADHGCLVEDDT